MTNEYPEYAQVVCALKPILYDLPAILVAIDGRPGVGKTTLGRYLAWTFNVSLVETDLFMIPDLGRLDYHRDEVRRVIDRRLDKPAPVIVEGVAILRLLSELSRPPNFLIYVSSIDTPESRTLKRDLASYDAMFKPKDHADLSITLSE